MNARVLTTFEHRSLPVGTSPGELSETEVQQLLTLDSVRPGFCKLGHRNVQFAQYAGLVRLDRHVLEILPKAGEIADPEQARGTLLRLLSAARDLPLTDAGVAAHDMKRQSLLDVFIGAFFAQLATLVRSGLVRRYRTEEADLPLIRGRMDLSRQVTALAMRYDRLACRFDELTIDNPWNQLLKTALQMTRPWIAEASVSRRWLDLSAAFDEVSPLQGRDILQLKFEPDRQVAHYAAAVQWARWILQLLSPSLRAGGSEAPAMLFDMNQLFERAVARVIGRAARLTGLQLKAQATGHHLAFAVDDASPERFRLRPDLVLFDGDTVVAVGDTKWTKVAVGSDGRLIPSEAQIYQLNAYASVYPCRDLALIYPHHEGLSGTVPSAFRLQARDGRQPVVHVLTMDVGVDGIPLVGCHHPSIFASVLG